ncbi:MAG: phosphosulfolactate synthase [Bacteroidia bacterium]|nr:MAG: phosphosulfolactate synthase [Bacteroidia bacterium]
MRTKNAIDIAKILQNLPERSNKPRTNGLTMVIDKGLGLHSAEDLMTTAAEIIDFVKIGFGTSIVTGNLKEKIKLYQKAGVEVYLGGTLLEAFLIRNQFEDYLRLIDDLNLNCVEVSDGSIVIPHEEKCELIHYLSKNFKVLSEVGSKEEGIIIHPNRWIKMMKAELQAGSFKVIAEARESGTVGIFHKNGSAHVLLIDKIKANVDINNIIWETPQKSQQVYFIKHFGSNVNLGNIPTSDIVALECLRLGLRGDTFFTFLQDKKKEVNFKIPK